MRPKLFFGVFPCLLPVVEVASFYHYGVSTKRTCLVPLIHRSCVAVRIITTTPLSMAAEASAHSFRTSTDESQKFTKQSTSRRNDNSRTFSERKDNSSSRPKRKIILSQQQQQQQSPATLQEIPKLKPNQQSSPQRRHEQHPQQRQPRTPSSSQQQQHRLRLPDVRTQLDFARNGHAVMRNVLDAALLRDLRRTLWRHGEAQELLAWQQKVEVAANSPSLAASCTTIAACQEQLQQLLGENANHLPFLQYFHTRHAIPAVNVLALSLAEIAATLLDVPAVRLYQDALFWKRPGDGPTPWHADARMAPFDTSHMVTLWVPLQPVPRDGTALIFCSKSHSDFALPYWNPYNADKVTKDPLSPWNRLEERYGVVDLDDDSDNSNINNNNLVDYMPLAVGDLTAHAGWTLHCTNPNDSSKSSSTEHRLALAITYVDARAIVRPRRGRSSTNKRKTGKDLIDVADGKDGKDDAGDPEDAWSYKAWISQVPTNTPDWDHPLVPIVWSKSTQRQPATKLDHHATTKAKTTTTTSRNEKMYRSTGQQKKQQ